MKKKAAERMRRRKCKRTKWEPQLREEVLLKCQPTSDATVGETAKFFRPFTCPWFITKIIPPSAYEISDKEGKIRGIFNKAALKRYLRDADER
jgi:hypothetical protein